MLTAYPLKTQVTQQSCMTELTTKPSSSCNLREKQHLAACSGGDQPQSPMDLVREKFPKRSIQGYYPASSSSFMPVKAPFMCLCSSLPRLGISGKVMGSCVSWL